MRLVAGTAIALVLSSTLAFSETNLDGSYVAAPAGTVMVWKIIQPGSVEQRENVMKPTYGYRMAFKRRGEEDATWVPFCYGCANHPFEEEKYSKLWPLEVGKSVTLTRTRRDNKRQWEHTIEVVGTEQVTVGAGSFDTFHIVERAHSVGRSWKAENHYWWAPSVGYMVKSKRQDNEGESSENELSELRR